MISYMPIHGPRYNKEQTTMQLIIHNSGFLPARNGYQLKKTFLNCFQLIYVTQGSVDYIYAKQEGRISQGEYIILKPYFTLETKPITCESATIYWVLFSLNDHELTKISVLPRNDHADSRLFSLLCLLVDSLRSASMKKIQEPLLLALLNLITNLQNNNQKTLDILDRVSRFLDENIAEPISAQRVAEALSYSKDYLSRVLQAETGKSLKAYINQHKLQSACQLLRNSGYSISEVGENIGYSDSNLFTKFFSYHMKMTPKAYRHGAL